MGSRVGSHRRRWLVLAEQVGVNRGAHLAVSLEPPRLALAVKRRPYPQHVGRAVVLRGLVQGLKRVRERLAVHLHSSRPRVAGVGHAVLEFREPLRSSSTSRRSSVARASSGDAARPERCAAAWPSARSALPADTAKMMIATPMAQPYSPMPYILSGRRAPSVGVIPRDLEDAVAPRTLQLGRLALQRSAMTTVRTDRVRRTPAQRHIHRVSRAGARRTSGPVAPERSGGTTGRPPATGRRHRAPLPPT